MRDNNLPISTITDSPDAVKNQLLENGVSVVENVLTQEKIDLAKSRLMDQLDAEKDLRLGGDRQYEINTAGKQGTFRSAHFLINKGEVFREIAAAPFPRKIIGECFASSYLPEQKGAIEGRERPFDAVTLAMLNGAYWKGEHPQQFDRAHTDQTYAPYSLPYAEAYTVMWALTEFTSENGTLVAPGSHNAPNRRDFLSNRPEMVNVIAPAGSAVIWDARLWHAAPPRTSTARIALVASYRRYYLRPLSNWFLEMPQEVFEKCSPELRTLLGYRAYLGYGSTESTSDGLVTPSSQYITELGQAAE